MDFKSKLYNILKDLKHHNRDRSTLLQESIEKRLDDALTNYNKDIAQSYNYLYYRDSLNVLRKLNRRK